MASRASSRDDKAWTGALAIWLLLLTILTHAFAPSGQPVQRVTGSAFSPWTVEVSLSPTRQAVIDRHAQVRGRDLPTFDGPAPLQLLATGTGPKLDPGLATRSSTGHSWGAPVSPLDPASSPFAARAPPSS